MMEYLAIRLLPVNRILGVVLALALIVSPCAVLKADFFLASGGNATWQVVEHVAAPALSHQHDSSGQSDQDRRNCQIHCLSWNTVSSPAVLAVFAEATKSDDGASEFPLGLGVQSDFSAGSTMRPPRVPDARSFASLSAPVYALTNRYRL